MTPVWCCKICYDGFKRLEEDYEKGTDLVTARQRVTDFVNLCFGAEAAEERRTYVPLDSVVILRADLPRRYGGGKALGLQGRLSLCDWCGRGRFPLDG